MFSPSIWYPPQIPITGVPSRRCSITPSAMPLSRIHSRSETVVLEPGSTIRSGLPISSLLPTNRSRTRGSRSRGSKSSKLAIRGSRTTAMSRYSPESLSCCECAGSSPNESSSGMWMSSNQGMTPTTPTPVRSRSISNPESRRDGSPRNLLMTNAFTRACSSGSRRTIVPTREANTPPRSMSPTMMTGALA